MTKFFKKNYQNGQSSWNGSSVISGQRSLSQTVTCWPEERRGGIFMQQQNWHHLRQAEKKVLYISTNNIQKTIFTNGKLPTLVCLSPPVHCARLHSCCEWVLFSIEPAANIGLEISGSANLSR